MNALRDKPRPFDVLIMAEELRLGREAWETGYALKRVLQAGVRLYYYLEDRERTVDGPTDRLLMSVMAWSDEMERGRARQRTRDALERKAERGHVTGGRVFGYDNVVILDASGRRSHVVRHVNEPEAAVVRRIFELAASGKGLRAIAHQLNDERALSPVPRRAGRPRGWVPSSIREVLHRELYRGRLVWGRTVKRDQWGQKNERLREEAAWVRHENTELCIVSDDLWANAHARVQGTRRAYLRGTGGHLWGRSTNGQEGRHLVHRQNRIHRPSG